MSDRLSQQDADLEHARAIAELYEQRDSLEVDLRHLAFHDELTGLPNRALLEDRLQHALAASTRYGTSVGLCFIDIDGFKAVNDGHGHHVGDAVLTRVAQLLTSIVRTGDTVARFGGDEFAVLTPGLEDPNVAVELAERMVAAFHASTAETDDLGLTVSVGVSFADSTKSAEELLSEADAAMYEAKANGKDRIEVFQASMRSRLLERLELTSGFQGALERGEFFLQYQPIISLADNRLKGFEALVRWNHPTLGLVPPLSFIPVAEDTGFIVPLGRWILIEACERLATSCSDPDNPLTLSINLSRRQLTSPSLVDDVRMALALSGVNPEQLILEITESILMADPIQATEALRELRALGIKIAVDDFGTGYSSLSHLQQFPVDVLKIDKSFVDPLNTSEPLGGVLVTTIINLAQSLGLNIIAEGIEHATQFDLLRDLGCDHGQGYLMARPLDVDDAEAFIEDSMSRVRSA
jgi:diguanylate cyclase (GGDEF)-like protein